MYVCGVYVNMCVEVQGCAVIRSHIGTGGHLFTVI